MATVAQSKIVTPRTKICACFFNRISCVCICVHELASLDAMKGGREGGAVNAPGSCGCSVI